MTNSLSWMLSNIISITKSLVFVDVPKISVWVYSTLTKWLKDFRESGHIPVRGSGNYASDKQKKIARLKAARKQNRRVSVSGMLKYLGVSRSGYRSWLNRTPSDTEKRKEYIKAKI